MSTASILLPLLAFSSLAGCYFILRRVADTNMSNLDLPPCQAKPEETNPFDHLFDADTADVP